ncbi:conserved hypothetical protein [Tenacibaculum maritimum]|uniref:Uncharacterized protein n=7 Tax=Tenacibaculum maritimum TaxID=107401 RepID=A0A2H1E8T2_9FLAO|nr:hypothetical protein B9C57_05180 [Tenacibaculum maritimum]SFZ81905.1 conserved protein of unknown function [Tenacibaculum maritimum NCIMB 2154]CAA0146521.1 conserved hypothetical protein [Tenacibaculum maritimum]CAA0146541.1 conserved hypothetical protein [Tenacibaculum maritimum]CAA0153583.1 conserved hypothetical protein [Tenacibaculum maritimum]
MGYFSYFMKKRFKIALNESGLKMKEVAEMLHINYDALRKGIDRGSMNNGYLILLEYKTGISKDYILEGRLPILKNKEDIILSLLDNDIIKLLDGLDKDKIVSYLSLREKEFQKMEVFNFFIEKQQASKRLRDIVEGKESK